MQETWVPSLVWEDPIAVEQLCPGAAATQLRTLCSRARRRCYRSRRVPEPGLHGERSPHRQKPTHRIQRKAPAAAKTRTAEVNAWSWFAHLNGEAGHFMTDFTTAVRFSRTSGQIDWTTTVQFFQSSVLSSVQCSSVAQSCLTLCDPMNCSTPGLPVHHQLPESTQTHVLQVGDPIQPSHPLSSPSPSALNLFQHQGLWKWVSSSHQVAKVLKFQLQHQSFQWTPRTDLL